MIEIDGSLGEGGGQIIRSALSLSALTGKAFRIVNVRKNRRKPGLRAQHLSAARAVKEISNADIEGGKIDSKELRFTPRTYKAGNYRFDIGTAGATPLVLQALLPPLIFGRGDSHMTLSGGTHVPISPPFHFIREIFLPTLGQLGISVSASILSYGFYPRGGGLIEAHVRPVGKNGIRSITFAEGKADGVARGVSGVANLPISIAERQKDAALNVLSQRGGGAEIELASVPSPGQGTFIFLKSENGPCRGGFSSIGVRGKRAETVGSEAAQALLDYWGTQGCMDPHLADQIVIYLALAEGKSSFTTTHVTMHLITNLSVIKMFLDIDYTVSGEIGAPGKITIQGAGFSR